MNSTMTSKTPPSLDIADTVSAFLSSAEMTGRVVARDEDLLSSGALDSLNIAQLIAFLEARFALTIPVEDVLPETMGSIAAITEYVTQKTGGAQGEC